MKHLWVDANVLLRFLTADPPGLAEKARGLMARAQAGEVTLILTPVILAEAVWTLESFYQFSRQDIVGALVPLVRAEGVMALESETLVEALHLYREKNVDFADAYLAAAARQTGEAAVASFDRDFDRLGVRRLEPPAIPPEER